MSIEIMFKKKLINEKLILFILAFLIAVPSNVELKQIGKFKDWTAYSEGEGRNLACMAVSKPKKEEGDYKKRGEVFSIITHLPGQDKFNEFSIVTGYNYKQGSNPEVIIGDLKFQLFTSGSRAWSFSVAEDLKIINSMKSSLKMRVKGTSSRGTITSDTYSLLGFSKAYQKINEACKK